MAQRILIGWNFCRALYFILGVFVIVQSVIDKQWLAFIFGVYFAGMGFFSIGCASGNCAVNNLEAQKTSNKN